MVVKHVRLLLVNNTSDTWQELVEASKYAGHDVAPVNFRTIGAIDPRGYDCAILSGGWWYDDETELLNNYAEELAFIKAAPIPILGICIGMQLMHVALDQSVPLLDTSQSGYKQVIVTDVGQEIFGFSKHIRVFKNHTRGIIEADPNFKVLASSPGHIEIMMHRKRPLLGVQFHPEVGQIADASKLLNQLLVPLI